MRLLSLSQLARWADATLSGDDQVVSTIGIDTRRLPPGAVYVALRGETFDGHDFCAEAEARGARALLVERRVESALPQLVCADTRLALGRIATELAATRTTCVIGITGSNGKTTTRTLALDILRQLDADAYSNPGNQNNEIGLPLALIEQPETARFGIYEMGAGAPGDIAYLAQIARPRISVVTNIASAHLERMGSLTGIADTKAAIYDILPPEGTAVINADDAFAPYFVKRAQGRQILRYGLDATADVRAADVVEHDAGSHFLLHSPSGTEQITVPLPGRHQISNALAAASIGLAAGASLQAVAQGLAGAKEIAGRQQVLDLPDGTRLLDDSYNANPGSMAAAIDTLVSQAQRGGRQAWLILGDMLELGPGAAVLHADVGRLARQSGVTGLFAVGEMSWHAVLAFGPGGEHFTSQAALLERLHAREPGAVVMLVKGSRGSRMDQIVAALVNTKTQENGDAA